MIGPKPAVGNTPPEETADGYGYGPRSDVLAWLKRSPCGDEAGDCMDAAVLEIERLLAEIERLKRILGE